MQTANLKEKDSIQGAGAREGNVKITYLAKGRPGSPNNYSAFITDTEAWTTPRHKHNFDQMKICLRGGTDYGSGVKTPNGSVLYSPEGVPYGPQSRESGTLQLTVQYGGSSGYGYVGNAERRAAQAELVKTGVFKDGIYTWHDKDGKKHNQDAFEACWEKVLGKPVEYPKPRYNEMIVMNPENYAWVNEGAPGVDFKWLGTFTERGTRVGIIRVNPGATLKAGLHRAPEILFVLKGNVTRGSDAFGQHTAFGLETMEGPVPITATEPTELWCLQMPVFPN